MVGRIIGSRRNVDTGARVIMRKWREPAAMPFTNDPFLCGDENCDSRFKFELFGLIFSSPLSETGAFVLTPAYPAGGRAGGTAGTAFQAEEHAATYG
jgi:hypothetical protein